MKRNSGRKGGPPGGRGWNSAWVAVCLAACVAVMPAGCGRQDFSEELAKHDAESRVAPGETIEVEGVVQFAEPKLYQEGVGVRAISQGNAVTISVHNMRESDFLLSPTDFGVIVDRNLHRVESGKMDFRRFPFLRLQPQATSAGVIVFRGLGDLAGARLVFNNPEIGKPFYVRIEGVEGEEREPRSSNP